MVWVGVFGAFPMRTLILMAAALACAATLSQAESLRMMGRWKVEITFANGESRVVGFEAQGAVWGPANPSKSKWTQGKDNAVTFSGPIEFPMGNVGRASGRLVFKGKLETDGSLAGEVIFSPLSEEQPPRRGTFKATRVASE